CATPACPSATSPKPSASRARARSAAPSRPSSATRPRKYVAWRHRARAAAAPTASHSPARATANTPRAGNGRLPVHSQGPGNGASLADAKKVGRGFPRPKPVPRFRPRRDAGAGGTSERLGVTDVGGTAVGVVQEEVPRTAIEVPQLRVTVTDVGGADGDGGVPRSLPAQLHVVGGVAAHGGGRGAVALAIDVVDVPGRGPVAEGPRVVQGGAQVRGAVAAGEVDHRTTVVVHHELVDPGHGQLVAQLTPVAQVELGIDAGIDTLGGD